MAGGVQASLRSVAPDRRPRCANRAESQALVGFNQARTFFRTSAATPSRRTLHGCLAEPARSKALCAIAS
jgi:hypothetical protein